jgi:hypothetical protein
MRLIVGCANIPTAVPRVRQPQRLRQTKDADPAFETRPKARMAWLCGGSHESAPMSFSHRSPLVLAFALAVLGATSALAAEEPSGCDKFKWDITRERAALTAPERPKLTSGAELGALPATGFTLGLVPPADAKLPSSPERAPKEGTFAAFAKMAAPPKAGVYTVSLSGGAWVDVVQDGQFLKPLAFSGATDCEGIRKTMKYELPAKPFVLQLSGSPATTISVAILPAAQ